MSSDTIFAIPTADLPADLPQQTVFIADDGATLSAFLVGPGGFDEWDALPTSYVVGSWDMEQEATDGYLQTGQTFDSGAVIGTPTFPLQPDYFAYIRPVGNQNGRATGELDSIRWAGHPPAKWSEDDHRYLSTDDPFTLTITRDDNTGPDWDSVTTYVLGFKVMHNGQGYQSQQNNNINREPGAAGSGPWWAVTEFGWGWTATMIEPSVSQGPITGYNIRAYPTAECVPGTQLYTSGNFANGSGAFTTSCPSGNWTPTPDAVNLALIFVGGGNSQNGIIIMDVGVDEVTAEFWSHDMV